MKRCIFILATIISVMAYADDIEINGQFVVAPIAADECNAAAITQPSLGISGETDLTNMLTYFWIDNDSNTSTDNISMPEVISDEKIAIYSLNGQKQNELKRGINIVVDSQGKVRKLIVR